MKLPKKDLLRAGRGEGGDLDLGVYPCILEYPVSGAPLFDFRRNGNLDVAIAPNDVATPWIPFL